MGHRVAIRPFTDPECGHNFLLRIRFYGDRNAYVADALTLGEQMPEAAAQHDEEERRWMEDPEGARERQRRSIAQMHDALRIEAARRPHEVVYDGRSLIARGGLPQPRTRMRPRRRGAGRPAARRSTRASRSPPGDPDEPEPEPLAQEAAA